MVLSRSGGNAWRVTVFTALVCMLACAGVLLGASPASATNSHAATTSTSESESEHGSTTSTTTTTASTTASTTDDATGGKPADGTVGNAGGKTPGGQSSGDKNNGGECDKNNGIGAGNPAHAGCSGSGDDGAEDDCEEAKLPCSSIPELPSAWAGLASIGAAIAAFAAISRRRRRDVGA